MNKRPVYKVPVGTMGKQLASAGKTVGKYSQSTTRAIERQGSKFKVSRGRLTIQPIFRR